MKICIGFVAMSMELENASPSQTMTAKSFQKIADREAALRKLTRIAQSNLHNTLRILKHAFASGIYLYRLTSRLIPLLGHADYVNPADVIPFLEAWRELNADVDLMVEAKQKDKAVIALANALAKHPDFSRVGPAVLEYK